MLCFSKAKKGRLMGNLTVTRATGIGVSTPLDLFCGVTVSA
jgi:hypothetical protein